MYDPTNVELLLVHRDLRHFKMQRILCTRINIVFPKILH